jgi:DNA-binding transcriptional LysR family regulator
VEPISGLAAGTLDVAFIRGPIESSEIEVLEVLSEKIVVMLPVHHPLARRKRIPVKSLHDLPCITMERALSPALYDAISALYRRARIRMRAVSAADNVLGHLRLVQEGMGYALLPDSMGALLPPGVVVRPLDSTPPPSVSVLLAWKAGNTSPMVRAFADLVLQSCGDSKARRATRRGKT